MTKKKLIISFVFCISLTSILNAGIEEELQDLDRMQRNQRKTKQEHDKQAQKFAKAQDAALREFQKNKTLHKKNKPAQDFNKAQREAFQKFEKDKDKNCKNILLNLNFKYRKAKNKIVNFHKKHYLLTYSALAAGTFGTLYVLNRKIKNEVDKFAKKMSKLSKKAKIVAGTAIAIPALYFMYKNIF